MPWWGWALAALLVLSLAAAFATGWRLAGREPPDPDDPGAGDVAC